MSSSTAERPILFFDGVCNLCNSWVQFIIRHDKRQRFLFASLQSERGREAQQHILNEKGSVPDSLLLFYNNKYYTKSAAALRTVLLLDGAWPLLSAGLVIPAFIRNFIYDRVARNRYRWFGKKDSCMIPTPELSARFLP